jgi:hypothetical protein
VVETAVDRNRGPAAKDWRTDLSISPLISVQIKDAPGRLQTRIAALSYGEPLRCLKCTKGEHGGEGGIRTHDTLASMPHFECGAFNHSTTSPFGPWKPRVLSTFVNRPAPKFASHTGWAVEAQARGGARARLAIPVERGAWPRVRPPRKDACFEGWKAGAH